MYLSALQQLDLSGSKITDNGLQHLIQLISFQRLDLCDCHKITGNGLQH